MKTIIEGFAKGKRHSRVIHEAPPANGAEVWMDGLAWAAVSVVWDVELADDPCPRVKVVPLPRYRRALCVLAAIMAAAGFFCLGGAF